jgi:hypothetical protein
MKPTNRSGPIISQAITPARASEDAAENADNLAEVGANDGYEHASLRGGVGGGGGGGGGEAEMESELGIEIASR